MTEIGYNEININSDEIDWSCDFKGYKLLEPLDWEFCRAVLGEFIATMTFLWVSISTVSFLYGPDSGGGAFLLSVAFAFGISIAVLVFNFGPISGGHINPAVSMGLFLRNKITFIKLVCYTVAQIMGSITGCAIVRQVGVTNYESVSGGINKVFVASASDAMLGEMMGTFLLVFTVFTVCDSRTQSFISNLAPLAIGLSVFLAHLALLGVTNCSINPARAIGASVVYGTFDPNFWVFVIGPYLGSIFAAVLYEFFKVRNGIDKK